VTPRACKSLTVRQALAAVARGVEGRPHLAVLEQRWPGRDSGHSAGSGWPALAGGGLPM